MKVIALDPGETVGWSVWTPEKPWDFLEAGQSKAMATIDAVAAATGLDDACRASPAFRAVTHRPDPYLVEQFDGWDLLICEDWSLYEDPANPGRTVLPLWDKCLTARYIGAFEFLARYAGKRIVLQPALIKNAMKGSGVEEVYLRPLHENRHANDSVQHAWYYFMREAEQGKVPLPGQGV